VLEGGVVEEVSAGMGRVLIVPGSPARRGIDLSAAAPAWERFESLARRLRGG
jgi:hypothetical protein